MGFNNSTRGFGMSGSVGICRKQKCPNCNCTDWGAKNDRYCSNCADSYLKAFSRAQFLNTTTGYLYSLDDDDVIEYKDGRWFCCSNIPAKHIRDHVEFKSI